MKLPQISQKFKWNYTALSFLMPMGILLVLMFVCSITPFGSQTILYSDNYHQYYPFFRQFRQALRSGDSLLWTWSVGMGMDYLGLISYYLASPLNLLSVLLPESWVLPYFTLLMPIKLGLASGFFALLLKKLFGTDDASLPLFGGFYGMCAWALGYQWNIMWLDTFALLPLVVLGTVLLLRDKKYLLYTLSLALAVWANYYVGLFVCIFIFLLFWCYEICRWKGFGRFVGDLSRIGVFTLLAIGMTAVLELPTLAALQDTYSSVNQFPSGFDLNIASTTAESAAKEAWKALKEARADGSASLTLWADALLASFPPLFDAMRQVAGQVGGGLNPTYMDGLPNLYCGVFPIALGFLFLMDKDIRLRDKLCALFLLTLFVCSFIFRQLDYIWHGFHFTNQIPYRFSFLFSFVVLYMAYRAWLHRDRFSPRQVLIAGIAGIALLLLSGTGQGDFLYFLFNVLFLILYLGAMIYGSPRLQPEPAPEEAPSEEILSEEALPEEEVPEDVPAEDAPTPRFRRWLLPPIQRRNIASGVIAGCMLLELLLHAVLFLSGFSVYDYDYPKKEDDAASMFAVLQEIEQDNPGFYRTEVTHAQTLNDGALNGYNGISTFTSSANVATTEFLQCLGAAAYNSWNRYCFEESSPVSNLFLNLKYLVERDYATQGNAYFDVVHSYKGITLLENNAYLPLGFLAEEELGEVDFSTNNRSFAFQNRLLQAATGLKKGPWNTLPSSALETTVSGDVTPDGNTSAGFTRFSTGANGGELIYTYTISESGFLCLDLNLYQQDDFTVKHNGTPLYSESYTLEQMLAVGDVVPGDTVELTIKCLPNQDYTSVSIKAAILDEALYRQAYDILNASTLELSHFSTNALEGTIHCNRDGLLYTSVPQDGNWVAYVDGEKAPITLVGDCMVSVPLTEGPHTIALRYENQAFRLGSLISLGCGLVLGLIVLCDYLIRRNRNK